MGRRLEFTQANDHGLFTYRYLSERSPFDSHWPGLFERYDSRGQTPWTEWAVNNNNTEEVALYLGLIWRLTEGRRRFVVPRYDRDAGMYAAGAPYALIAWEHEVEDIDRGEPGRITGFVPARSSLRIMPAPGPWERENAGRAGLFDIAAFAQLKDIVRGLLSDTSGELNLYALEKPPKRVLPDTFEELLRLAPDVDERGDALAAALMAERAPDMAELLNPGEIFVNLTIGVDVGYADVIVIHTLEEIGDSLSMLLDEYQAAVDAYEASIAEAATFEEFSSRLRQLVGVVSAD